jgi:hypothetical protein
MLQISKNHTENNVKVSNTEFMVSPMGQNFASTVNSRNMVFMPKTDVTKKISPRISKLMVLDNNSLSISRTGHKFKDTRKDPSSKSMFSTKVNIVGKPGFNS